VIALAAALALQYAQAHPFAGSSGTFEDPYQIETAAQLDAILTDPNANFTY